MGLFSRKNKEEKHAELVAKEKEEILNTGEILVNLNIGEHGADELIAGSMLGSTGAAIGALKYGKPKWQPTYISLYYDGFIIKYNGLNVLFEDILEMNIIKTGIMEGEFTILVNNVGNLLFKTFNERIEATISVIQELKEKHLLTLKEKESEPVKNNDSTDRLLRITELYERGLLSDEEFAEAKKKLLDL